MVVEARSGPPGGSSDHAFRGEKYGRDFPHEKYEEMLERVEEVLRAVLPEQAGRDAMLCYATLCYAMPCHAMLCYAMLCCAVLCYAVLCYAMLCYAMLCYAMPEQAGRDAVLRLPSAADPNRHQRIVEAVLHTQRRGDEAAGEEEEGSDDIENHSEA